jgi:hypothetical protein
MLSSSMAAIAATGPTLRTVRPCPACTASPSERPSSAASSNARSDRAFDGSCAYVPVCSSIASASRSRERWTAPASGSMNRLVRTPARFNRASPSRSFAGFLATSSPPSVVTSSRRSGTSVIWYGFTRSAMVSISSVSAISRLNTVRTELAILMMSSSCICRRSSRKCAVIPSAPASSQSAAAATGSGSSVRRAWRSVATWSTFMYRRW